MIGILILKTIQNQTFFQEYPETNEVIRLDIGDNIDRWHPMTDISKGKCNVQFLNELKIDLRLLVIMKELVWQNIG